MVSIFTRSAGIVDFTNKGFILMEGSVDTSGYRWQLTLPSDNPDSTVVIEDGRSKYEFTDVGKLNRDSGARNTEPLDDALFAKNRTGFESVLVEIGEAEYEWRLYIDGTATDPITINIGDTDHTFTGVDKIGEDVYAENKQ